MGYEILYHRFLVYDPDKKSLKPYIIYGSNNCYYYQGKRERNILDIEKTVNSDSSTFLNPKYYTLYMYLDKFYNIIKPDINSGYFTRVPKTKKGFINGFFKKVIDIDTFKQFTNLGYNGNYLDQKLTVMTKHKQFLKYNTYTGECNYVRN